LRAWLLQRPTSPVKTSADPLNVRLPGRGAKIWKAGLMQSSTVAKKDPAALLALVDELLGAQRLILVSNRGPMEYHVQPSGELQPRRGSGGVVTALSGLTNYVDFTWIASAMGDRKSVV
jgi:hypothetical protein